MAGRSITHRPSNFAPLSGSYSMAVKSESDDDMSGWGSEASTSGHSTAQPRSHISETPEERALETSEKLFSPKESGSDSLATHSLGGLDEDEDDVPFVPGRRLKPPLIACASNSTTRPNRRREAPDRFEPAPMSFRKRGSRSVCTDLPS